MSGDDRESGGANDRTEPQETEVVAILASVPEVFDATAALCERLQFISNAKPQSTIDPALAERRRYIQILYELSQFLKRVWIDSSRITTNDRLYQLCVALDQLEKGVVHPIFQPPATGRAGVKPDRFDIWDGRKWVCLAVECYIKTGKKTSETVRLIARNNPRLKAFIRTGTGKSSGGLAKAILSWHRGFQDGTSNELAQSGLEEVQRLLKEEFPAANDKEWLDCAQIFLTKANEAATTLIKTK